jgi:hypothetical protein
VNVQKSRDNGNAGWPATLYKARAAFSRSNTTVLGSISSRDMDTSVNYVFHHQGEKNKRVRNVFLFSVPQFLVTVNDIPSSLILSTMMMEALYSSET